MPAISESFVQRVISSGLLSAADCADVSAILSEDASPEQAAAYLLEHDLLTAYQVAQLTKGRTPLVLGQYHILDELGRGGFGCVYKARHRMMDRVVALKVISPTLVESDRARTNFRREVLATTKLSHANIVTAYDANEVDGVLFFVMEYVDGMNLHQLVKKHGPLSFRLATELLIQVAQGLQYAHEQGLVHRDIKPPNLLIPRQAVAKLMGQNTPLDAAPVLVKVVDFGLARLCIAERDAATPYQSERGFLGTPDYVSPEQARNSQAVDIRSDLYSLGCTLYFALTGRPPFEGESIMEIVVQHLEKQPRAIEQLRPETPPVLASIVRRLLAKDPNRRFQTPAELIAEMRFFLGTRGSGLVALPSIEPSPRVQTQLEPESSMPATVQTPLHLPVIPRVPASKPASTPPPPTINTVQSEYREPNRVPDVRLAPVDVKQLPALWRRWSAVLDGETMSDEDYRALHGQLLRILQAEVDSASGERREACQRLLVLVQPWLSIATLRQLDRRTLEDLRHNCQHLGQALGLASKSSGWWMFVLFLLGLAATSSWIFFAAPNADYERWIAGVIAFVKSKPILGVSLVLPLLCALAAIVMSFCRRSPPGR